MRKYRHATALVFLLLSCVLARADFSDAWDDYFATHEIAAEAYSGSVERCRAAGVEPNEPSFWDYLLGKNRAKLLSVKSNIKAVRPYYIRPQLADTNGSYLSYLSSGGEVKDLFWTNDAAFLWSLGLPTNALDETPWFKLQYPTTTGGWHTARICLSNLVVMYAPVDWTPNHWTNRHIMSDGSESTEPNSFSDIAMITRQYLLGYWHDLLGVDISRDMDSGIRSYYEFFPYYETNLNQLIPSLPIPLPSIVKIYDPETDPKTFYVPNARGSWTTLPFTETWSTSYVMAADGWKKSLDSGIGDWPEEMQPPIDYGILWTNALKPYMVKTRPRAIVSATQSATEQYSEPCEVTNRAELTVTNYPQIEVVSPIYEIELLTNTLTFYTTNILYDVQTNIIESTNYDRYVSSSNAVTNTIFGLVTNGEFSAAISFGAAFVGTYIETNIVSYSISAIGKETNWAFVYQTNATPTNIYEITNIFAGVQIITNEEDDVHSQQTTNIIGYATNYIDDTEAEPEISVVTNDVVTLESNRITTARFASGAVIANGIPFVGTEDVYQQLGLGIGPLFPPEKYPTSYPYSNDVPAFVLYTGAYSKVNMYYKWTAPSNVPFTVKIWHGYEWMHSGLYSNHQSVYSTFLTSGDPGWVEKRYQADNRRVRFGENVFPNLNLDDNGDLSDSALFEAMDSQFIGEFGSEPPPQSTVYSLGREIAEEWAAVWWNGTNGFRWK